MLLLVLGLFVRRIKVVWREGATAVQILHVDWRPDTLWTAKEQWKRSLLQINSEAPEERASPVHLVCCTTLRWPCDPSLFVLVQFCFIDGRTTLLTAPPHQLLSRAAEGTYICTRRLVASLNNTQTWSSKTSVLMPAHMLITSWPSTTGRSVFCAITYSSRVGGTTENAPESSPECGRDPTCA